MSMRQFRASELLLIKSLLAESLSATVFSSPESERRLLLSEIERYEDKYSRQQIDRRTTLLPDLSARDIERFWRLVDTSGKEDCWEWKVQRRSDQINALNTGLFTVR